MGFLSSLGSAWRKGVGKFGHVVKRIGEIGGHVSKVIGAVAPHVASAAYALGHVTGNETFNKIGHVAGGIHSVNHTFGQPLSGLVERVGRHMAGLPIIPPNARPPPP